MFRNTLTLVFAAMLAGGSVADEAAVPPSAEQTMPDTRNEALEIMRDHVRSQMDWRSYFSNRMEVRRRELSTAEKLRGQPSTAGTLPRQ